MSQYNNNGQHTGQSRSRGTAKGQATRGQGSRSRTGRRSGAPSRQDSVRRMQAASNSRKHSSRRGGPDYDYRKIFIGGVILIAAIAAVVFLLRGAMKGRPPAESESETETSATEPVTELQKEVTVDGINITGMSMAEARSKLLEQYPWALTVTYEGDVCEVTDLMADKVDGLLAEIYAGEAKETYTLDTSGLDGQIEAEAEAIGARWDKRARNGSISSYDASRNEFIFTGAENGVKINRERLAADIAAAVAAKDFDMVIAAAADVVEPEISEAGARERYRTIATFTTNTTANSNRNTNVRLAAEAVNGTIIQPGEEFSFNQVVGQRTEAKGYKGAAAYNNGLVVEEIGGGVCQVSSTLYNAVVKAGFKTTVRRSHTFEPSYVRPGTDATISWAEPDYKFRNDSSSAIGIRASYADRKMTVSIYGIPILEEGVTYELQSTKVADTDEPAPIYEEDQTLQLDVEKVKTAGSKGSRWEVRLIVKKDGNIVSQEIDHTITYKGHNSVILRNTSGVVLTDVETVESSSGPASEGAGDGFVDGLPGTSLGPVGPGFESAVSPTSGAAYPSATAPASSADKPAGPGSQAQTTPAAPASATSAPTTSVPTAPVPTTPALPSPPPTSGADVGNAPGQSPSGDTIPTVVPKPGNGVTSANGPGAG